jgi:hypothetical protein
MARRRRKEHPRKKVTKDRPVVSMVVGNALFAEAWTYNSHLQPSSLSAGANLSLSFA